METTRLRIKKEYAPLTVYTSLVVPTNGFSTLLQTYKAKDQEYIPNRQLTPTTIMPKVLAYAPDGSLKTPYANSMLADLTWYVDGTEISEVWTEGTDYEILTVGSDRGGLVVYRNIPTTEQHRLHFEAVLADSRLGQNIEVKTNDVTLRTIDLAEFQYKISVGCDPVVHYNPFTDPLLIFEHKQSHGIAQNVTEQQAAASKLSYLCNIPIMVFKGDAQATAEDDYTVKLFRIGANNALTEIDASPEHEVQELDRNHILIDLRLIDDDNYAVIVYVRGEEKDRTQFGLKRLKPKYTQITHANQTGIVPTAKARYDYLTMEHNGKILDCPGLSLQIVWYTDTEYKKGVMHNEGEDTLFSLSKTGIGANYDDDWLEIYTNIEYKPAYSGATDGEYILTDETGKPFIFN